MALFLVVCPSWMEAEAKFALVIGNGAYTYLGKLTNPPNDAIDMRASLENLGFQVELLRNVSLSKMIEGFNRLKRNLASYYNSYGFFYFAGYGVQSEGENYLIPVDANIPTESQLRTQSLPVRTVLEGLNQTGDVTNVVVLDACRSNPFRWARKDVKGLAPLRGGEGNLVVYAAGADSSVVDNVYGRNSVFTKHLLHNIINSDLEAVDVFRRTSVDVRWATNGAQIPAIYDKSFIPFYLGKTSEVKPLPVPLPPGGVLPWQDRAQAGTVTPSVQNNSTREMIYIQGGIVLMGSPGTEPGRNEDEGPQHWVTLSPYYLGREPVTVRQFADFVTATNYRTEAETLGGGYIWSGVAWEQRVDANWRNPYFLQAENQPVVLVSWLDAVQYCNWRSRNEGMNQAYQITRNSSGDIEVNWNRGANGYRLPTEAEWEYACRAGTTTPFSTGINITTSQANFDGRFPYNQNERGTYRGKTTPVGGFPPNPWGFYDMHGNIWEWCWDWYAPYGSTAQWDPSGGDSGRLRVRRGGSWGREGSDLRSARRSSGEPSYRGNFIGFRIARSSLEPATERLHREGSPLEP